MMMTRDGLIKTPRKRKIASLDRKKARGGWIFVLPFVLGFVLVYLPILIDSIKYSFSTRMPIVAGQKVAYEVIGWANYKEALTVNPDFVQTLLSGLSDMVFEIPMILIFSLFMAVLLNQKMVGRAAFRAIFFVPVILSTGLMASIQSSNATMMGAMESGGIDDGSGADTTGDIVSSMDIEQLFSGMAVGQGLVEYVASAINNIYDIVNRSGVQMLIFLAGLQSISPAIYESVQIDGASSWETFWKITFPMISPMILVNAVYTIIDSFTAESNVVMKFISKAEFNVTSGLTSEAVETAMSWIYFLVVLIIVAAVAGIFSAYVFYQKRD